MSKNTTIRESLEKKYGDLTGLIEAIKLSNHSDSIVLPAGMSILEFWELSNEVAQK